MSQNKTNQNPATSTNRPRIYVASLADYNSGRLHGRWIVADQPAANLRQEVAEMLNDSPEPIAEEWAIHDYEFFAGLTVGEFEDLEKVAEAALLIAEHGPVFAGLTEHLGGVSNLDEAKRYMEEGYRGEWDSLRDYAEQLVEDCYGDVLARIPDFIKWHIDYDGIGQDLELGGDIFTVEVGTTLHVFDSQI